MVTRLHRRFARRPLSTAVLTLACAVVFLCAGALGVSGARLAAFAASSRDVSAIRAVPTAAPTSVLHFRYRGLTRFVRVAVDPAELAAARRLDTSRVFSTVGPVREAYVRNVVAATSASGTVRQIADQLRRMRTRLALDDDSYVELVARFVQEIPYGTIDAEVKLPAEVATQGSGVCDDKSVLLAAVLVHEGYDTAVWAFDSQAHVAVGVRCLGSGMRGSRYAYIETTTPAYIGQVSGTYGSFAAWRRSPQLIQVGGTKRYTADLESAFIARVLERARTSARWLEPYRDRLGNAPSRWKAEYISAAERQATAQKLASWLQLTRDDRETAYALLTRSGGR